MKRRTPLLAGALTALSLAALALPASTFAAVAADSQTQFLSLLNGDRQSAGPAPPRVCSTPARIPPPPPPPEPARGTPGHQSGSAPPGIPSKRATPAPPE